MNVADSVPSITKAPDDDNAALWRSATTQVRDTIKYVVAGFAAVGAILVGTAPLTGIGTITGYWWIGAVAGATAAVAGVIFAVWQASDVLFPSVATLDQVVAADAGTEMARLRDDVLSGSEGMFRQWGGTIAAFRSQRELEYNTLREIDAYMPEADEKAALAEARSNVVGRIEQLNRAAEVALAGAQYADTRDRALDRRKGIALAACAVALGVACFTFAANRKSVQPVIHSRRAAQAVVSFTPAGRKEFGELLGDPCVERAPALVLGGEPDGPWEIATTGDGGCRPARFKLTAEQGEPVYVQAQRVMVTLKPAGNIRLSPVLGNLCVSRPFEAIDLGRDGKRTQLLALATNACTAARFTLTSDEGTVTKQ